EVRRRITAGYVQVIGEKYPQAEAIIGTSTSGIGYAALVAEAMNLPTGYVRGGQKSHGRNNQIEGRVTAGQQVVVVEDLISTAGSVIEVVDALRDAGAVVLGIVSIFTYGMAKGLVRLNEANVENTSLTNFDALAYAAVELGHIPVPVVNALVAFRNNPSDPQWMELLG
ncbi:MAG: orotate phosphoribosyltransferase, partial [Oscillospiraceae bacterium]|nr:orotate phosphoribosyltransferase [Oscillospiraceae bacterium]